MAFPPNYDAVYPRALGNPTSSSTAPSGTSTSNDDDNHGNSNNNSLQIGGSPPLIIAFLAVGLFIAALVAVFGWRRVVLGRRMAMMHHFNGGLGGHMMAERVYAKRPDFGAKPELFDLKTEVYGSEQEKWDQIMPFSAGVINPRWKASTTHRDANTQVPSNRITAPLQALRQHIHRHDNTIDAVSERVGSPKLQVAVAIAMPSSRQRYGPEKAIGAVVHDDEPLVYALGLVQVPWESEER